MTAPDVSLTVRSVGEGTDRTVGHDQGVSEPFYLPRGGDRYFATGSTVGPWYADAQHGGPPSALLVRALEQCDARPGTQLSRITVEVLGRVPAGDVEVHASVERPGRAIALLAAEMTAGGRAVLRARAWRITETDTTEIAHTDASPMLPPTDGVLQTELPPGWLPGFPTATEWRWLKGGLGEQGPGAAWIRQLVPLVEGEEPSPLQRLVAIADCANGVSASLDVRRWLFVNTELTIHLHRRPVGEWTGIESHTVFGATGLGTVSALLFDEQGHVGRATQGLIVQPRA